MTWHLRLTYRHRLNPRLLCENRQTSPSSVALPPMSGNSHGTEPAHIMLLKPSKHQLWMSTKVQSTTVPFNSRASDMCRALACLFLLLLTKRLLAPLWRPHLFDLTCTLVLPVPRAPRPALTRIGQRHESAWQPSVKASALSHLSRWTETMQARDRVSQELHLQWV